MGKFSSDGRPDLRHLLGRTEPVKPRYQRCVQTCGNRLAGCRIKRRSSDCSTSSSNSMLEGPW
jgi:hypothetical protein